jgi:hypothetical protein
MEHKYYFYISKYQNTYYYNKIIPREEKYKIFIASKIKLSVEETTAAGYIREAIHMPMNF